MMSPESVAAIDAAADEGEPILVSLITAWELGLLEAKGRLPMSRPARVAFDTFVSLPGMQPLALSVEALVSASFLPQPLHRDPADRILIATARALDLTIVTRDEKILEYANKGHVRAIAC